MGDPTEPDIIAGMTGSAHYSGHFFEGSAGVGTVNMTVNFSDASWAGTFNGGSLAMASTGHIPTGTNNFISDSITGTLGAEAITGGGVEGVFIGSNAQSAIGVVDVQSANNEFVQQFGVTQGYTPPAAAQN